MARQDVQGSTRSKRPFSASLVPFSVLVNSFAQSAARERQSSTNQIKARLFRLTPPPSRARHSSAGQRQPLNGPTIPSGVWVLQNRLRENRDLLQIPPSSLSERVIGPDPGRRSMLRLTPKQSNEIQCGEGFLDGARVAD